MTAITRRDKVGAEYVWVPPGIGLEGFWMMRTPVTNAMWRMAVEAGAVEPPSHPFNSLHLYGSAAMVQHPVVWVLRDMAEAYAAWVGGRLPRDAEWTRACQGDDGRKYPWGNQRPDKTRANYRNNVGDTTTVGGYPAGSSAYGVLDMAGNVWEWVDDDSFVVRGGAWYASAGDVVCGARLDYASVGNSDVGFRVVSARP